MSSRQDETGGAMVETRNFGVQPIVRCMAVFAGSLELRLDVARVGGRCKFLLVTGEAGGRHRLEFAISPAFVAGIAVDGGMRPR